jgi:DNA-binding protein HU-beta
MTKADLIAAVAADAGITKSVAEKALNAVVDTIEKALKKGDKITLTGFGTFQWEKRSGLVPAAFLNSSRVTNFGRH